MPDFTDVLPLLRKACDQLHHGELIQSTSVSLFEATSAIEIGEPRMDAGVSIAEAAAQPVLDAHRALLPQEICWIMDRMLCAQIAWLEGAALSQTVLTCAYVHELETLRNASAEIEESAIRRKIANYPAELVAVVLHGYLRGVLKTCDIMMEEMLKGHIYDNEDFISDKCGVSLLEDVEIDTVLDELEQANDWLADWEGELAYQCQLPLMSRLNLQKELLCAICLFELEEPVYHAVPGHIDAARQTLDRLTRERPTTTTLIRNAAVAGAFNPYLARQLESLSPPRPALAHPTVAYAESMVLRLITGLAYSHTLANIDSWDKLEQHFTSAARHPDLSLPFFRSLNQSILSTHNRICVNHDLAWLSQTFLACRSGRSIVDVQHSISTLTNSLHEPHRQTLVNTLETLSKLLLDYLRGLSQNGPRRYRKLANMASEWQALSASVQTLINTAHSLHFDVTAIAQLPQLATDMQADCIIEILLSGFELDLFDPSEYAYIYWLLWKAATLRTSSANTNETVSAAQYRRKAVVSHLARITFALLCLCDAPSLNGTTAKQYARRLKWMPITGPLTANWIQYTADVKHLKTSMASSAKATIADDFRRIHTLLQGRPGTGKTDAAYVIALAETTASYAALFNEGKAKVRIAAAAVSASPSRHFPIFESR